MIRIQKRKEKILRMHLKNAEKTEKIAEFDKENPLEWIKLQVDNGIFFPGKVAMGKVFNQSLQKLQTSERQPLKPLDSKSRISKYSSPKNSNKKPVYNSPVFKKEHKNLIDSFQSYYESEKKSFEIIGKCKQSYISFKLNHDKIKKTKRIKMKREIKSLKKLNSSLKEKIRELGSKSKESKTATPNSRWISRNSPSSTGRLRTCFTFKTNRKHCYECDELLAQGLSSGYCLEHSQI